MRVLLKSTGSDFFWMKLAWIMCSEKQLNMFDLLMDMKSVRLELDQSIQSLWNANVAWTSGSQQKLFCWTDLLLLYCTICWCRHSQRGWGYSSHSEVVFFCFCAHDSTPCKTSPHRDTEGLSTTIRRSGLGSETSYKTLLCQKVLTLLPPSSPPTTHHYDYFINRLHITRDLSRTGDGT